ncbi:MAG: sulfatase [Salinirussus sp.]
MPSGVQNVLFVVLDTVRKDRLSVYGHDEPTSPTLEKFAEEAGVYEEAVAPAPWTLPVHASMFTGLYPSQHRATQEDPYLEGVGTLAEALSAAGFATCCYSSNAWITPYTGLTAGFDDQDNFFKAMPGWLPEGPLARGWRFLNDHERLRGVADSIVAVGNAVHERLAAGGGEASKTPAVINRTIDFVDQSERFFAFINLMDAHLPYHPPDEYAERFAPGIDSTEVCQNSKAYNIGATDIDHTEWEAIRDLYDAEIRHMDDQLDRLFSHLKETGRWEDTMVIVTADHGELHGEHGLYGHEFNVYDELVNVPFLVKHPSIEPERITDTQIELIDLYHTILDATDVVPTGEPVDPRRSIVANDASPNASDEGETPPPAASAFIEYHRPVVELNQLESIAADADIDLSPDSRWYSRMRSARRPAAKYIRNERIADEAYRLDSDPGETENIAGDGDDLIEHVTADLEGFEAALGGGWGSTSEGDPLSEMDAATTERLRDLGYVE